MGSDDCQLRTIACGRGCRIDCCDHGTIHLTLGDVTLRLQPAALGGLIRALSAAQRHLALDEPAAARRPC